MILRGAQVPHNVYNIYLTTRTAHAYIPAQCHNDVVDNSILRFEPQLLYMYINSYG